MVQALTPRQWADFVDNIKAFSIRYRNNMGAEQVVFILDGRVMLMSQAVWDLVLFRWKGEKRLKRPKL